MKPYILTKNTLTAVVFWATVAGGGYAQQVPGDSVAVRAVSADTASQMHEMSPAELRAMMEAQARARTPVPPPRRPVVGPLNTTNSVAPAPSTTSTVSASSNPFAGTTTGGGAAPAPSSLTQYHNATGGVVMQPSQAVDNATKIVDLVNTLYTVSTPDFRVSANNNERFGARNNMADLTASGAAPVGTMANTPVFNYLYKEKFALGETANLLYYANQDVMVYVPKEGLRVESVTGNEISAAKKVTYFGPGAPEGNAGPIKRATVNPDGTLLTTATNADAIKAAAPTKGLVIKETVKATQTAYTVGTGAYGIYTSLSDLDKQSKAY